MANTAKLYTTVTLTWENRRGCDRDCEVEVAYTFDGEDLNILSANVVGSCDLDDYTFDDMVFDAVSEVAPDAYADWLADYGDYLHEQRRDRAAMSYVPAGAL